MISPDAVVPSFPIAPGPSRAAVPGDEYSISSERNQVPDFANNLLLAVDEAWSNLSTLAKCSSHKDLCAVAGARFAKELHAKGATTGPGAFESFKSLYERFIPSPNTLLEVPLPSVDNKTTSLGVGNIFSSPDAVLNSPNTTATTSTANSNSFSNKFETVLKKVHWSPAERTTTSRTAGIQPSSRSSDGKMDGVRTACSARVQPTHNKRTVASMVSAADIVEVVTRDPKRHKP